MGLGKAKIVGGSFKSGFGISNSGSWKPQSERLRELCYIPSLCSVTGVRNRKVDGGG